MLLYRWLQARPVLSLFDRFLVIGPRATFNRSKLTLSVFSARAGQVFLRCFEKPKRFSIFFQLSLKIQYKLALLPPSNYTKDLFYNHLGIQYSDKTVAVSQNVFAISKVKPQEKAW